MNINLDISGSKDVIYVDEQDTSTSIVFYIKDNGSAVDLTGLTLSFVLHRTSYIVAPLTITSASSGIATLTLTSAMTASPGTLAFEVVGMESDDTPEFDISSYMVVQKVYSGSDGQNDPDEENPGIDVLYGEEAPDDETDGEDKDFYLQLKEETADILEENDYTSTATASNPIEPQNWVKTSRNEFSFDIYGKPNNVGAGEYIDFNLHGLVEGHTYAITFKFQFASGATFPWGEYNDYLNICGTRIDFATDTQEHTHTATFTYEEGGVAQFGFPRIQDDRYFTAHITNLTVTGDFTGDIEDLYNKKDGYWKKYIPHEMIGATSESDGESGTVPKPTIADKDKFLKGDGTWAEAGGGGGSSALSDLTDVELTDLADGEILKYDAATQKWLNAVESGGGGGAGGTPMVFQHAAWITSTSSSSGTALTNALTLEKGRYLIMAHTPLTNENQAQLNKDYQFCLKVNGTIANDSYRIFNEQYGECAWLIDLPQNSTVILCAGMSTSKTWLSQYLDRGGIDAVLLSKNDSPIIYSTEEQEIGVWVNNKPLYSKSVTTGGSAPSDTTLIQRIAQTGYDTLLYTKNADTAGSGTYSTFGEYMVHYSTSEKVIGTWTDGKPLYQKTIEQQWTTRDNSTLTINGIDNTMIIRDFRGVTEYKDGTAFYPLGMNGSYTTYPLNAYNSIRVNTIYGSSVQYVFRLTLTIIYTKTTD